MSDPLHIALLVEFEFAAGTERYWTGLRPLTWDSATWQPTGNLAEISAMESSEDTRANGLELSMSGLPPDAFAGGVLLRAEDYKGRAARFIIAVMDSTFTTVLESYPRRYGIDRLDYSMNAATGGSATVYLENELILAARRRVRRYANSDQQAEFPTDKGLEFMQFLSSGVEVKWGVDGVFFK